MEAHKAMAQVDVVAPVVDVVSGADGLGQAAPFGFEDGGVVGKLGVEHVAAPGSRLDVEAVDDKEESGVVFYQFLDSHWSIFFTS